jgi:hypothetical protein
MQITEHSRNTENAGCTYGLLYIIWYHHRHQCIVFYVVTFSDNLIYTTYTTQFYFESESQNISYFIENYNKAPFLSERQ